MNINLALFVYFLILIPSSTKSCGTEPVSQEIDMVSITLGGVSKNNNASDFDPFTAFELSVSRYWPLNCKENCWKLYGVGVNYEILNGASYVSVVGKASFGGLMGLELGPIISYKDYGVSTRYWFGFGYIGWHLEANYLLGERGKFVLGGYAAIPFHVKVEGKHDYFPKNIPIGFSD